MTVKPAEPAITLRNLQLDDADLLAKLDAGQSVHEFIGGVSKPPMDSATRISVIQVGLDAAGIVAFVGCSWSTGDEIELICAVLEKFEGRGIATAACEQLLNDANGRGATKHVVACISPNNRSAESLAAKSGFVLTTRMRANGDRVWVLK